MTASERFSRRVNDLVASPIREILAVIDRPGMVSFAGGLPAPQRFPALAPGDFNPAVPGTTLASGTGDMSTFATAGQGSGAAPGPVDNSININGNMGMDPTSVRTQLHSEQNARTRTTKVNG